MVRDGDDDRVDVRPCKQVLIVFVDVNFDFLFSQGGIMLCHPMHEAFALDVIYVTSGDNADILHGEEKVEQHQDLLSQTDESEVDFVVGGLFSRGRRGG